MRILFISRAYPPVIGGIENHNRDLAFWLGKKTDLTLIANRRGKSFFPLFLPYAFIRSLFNLYRNDVLLVGDGVLAPVAFVLSWFCPKMRTACVVHGLDLRYGSKPGILSKCYQAVNIPSLRAMDHVFAVSEFTKREAVKVGIEPDRITVIQNGIDPDALIVPKDRAALDTLLGTKTGKRFVIVRIGRYVKHKGVEWFIRNVVPRLPDEVLFVAAGGVVSGHAAGDEDYFPLCARAVSELGLERTVQLLTNLPRPDILTLLNSADLAVSPNIPVPGTMEGFGINVIEANACGLPVIASDLEGLTEAIVNGENGSLLEAGNADAYVAEITRLIGNREQLKAEGIRANSFVRNRFHWDALSDRYIRTFEADRPR
ncbi:MAG: glycosyltransferase family 4 protein [Candidatus Moraniibacteriota bacterium]